MTSAIPDLRHPTLHTAGLAALESLVNRALTLDPGTRKRLAQLDGHVFLFHCTAPALAVYLIPAADGVRLWGQHEGPADTTLAGNASDFAQLVSADDPASVLINSPLELHGDSQALIELQKILHQLDIDWEAPLAELLGDVAGHQIGRTIRRGWQFGRQALDSLRRQAREFLVEESDWLAARWQVEQFCNDVDQLALRTERLQARLEQWRRRQQPQQRQPRV